MLTKGGSREMDRRATLPPLHSAERRVVTMAIPGRTTGNRQGYLVALLPLLLLGATSVAAFAHRVIASHAPDPIVGDLSRSEADWVARLSCCRLTGDAARVVEAEPLSAFAVSHHAQVYGWNVRCRTADGDYLVRVNAQTFRIYGVDRIIPSADNDAGAAPEKNTLRLSRRDAERQARCYLHRVGLPAQDVARLALSHVSYSAFSAVWTFRYLNSVPRRGIRTLSVTIDAHNGRLVNLWDPAHGV
jgi:hypothetical protein